MSKTLILSMIVVFLTLIVPAPLLIAMADDTVKIEFFENSEEEKENRGEHNVEIETLLSNPPYKIISLEVTLSKNNLGNFFKGYLIPHLNLISPPPERV